MPYAVPAMARLGCADEQNASTAALHLLRTVGRVGRANETQMRAIVLSTVIAAALGLAGYAPVAATGCGIKPIRPLTPLGCKSLELECVCDEHAEKCAWQWRCVK